LLEQGFWNAGAAIGDNSDLGGHVSLLDIELMHYALYSYSDFLIIDPHPVSSYNTFMSYVSRRPGGISAYYGGFFRPDHDPPRADSTRVYLL